MRTLESRRCLARHGPRLEIASRDPLVAELRLLCRDEVALIEAPALIIEEGRARQPISL
jgi:hypothetical protein